MFIKHGTPEKIRHVLKDSEEIDDFDTKRALEDLKNKSLEEDKSDLNSKRDMNVS